MLPTSIIVLNYNGEHILRKCFPSVAAAVERRQANDELIVVDNASQDGSVEYLKSTYPEVQVEVMPENRYLFAINEAMEKATYDQVIFLVNDIIVEPDFIAPLLVPFEGNDSLFAVSAKLMRWEDPTLHQAGEGYGSASYLTFQRGFLKSTQRSLEFEQDLSGPVYSFHAGGCSAYDRRKFLDMGGFDPLFKPFYWEDIDLSYRAWKRGYTILYQPMSVMYHNHLGATLNTMFPPEYVNRMISKNGLLFMWKNVTDRKMLALHLCYVGLRLVRWPSYRRPLRLALKQWPEARRQRRVEQKEAKLNDWQVINLLNQLGQIA